MSHSCDVLIEIGFSFTGNEALNHHNKTNSKQGKLEGGLLADEVFVLVYR